MRSLDGSESKEAPILFRCAPVRIKCGRCSSRTSSNVCLSSLASKSGCSGLLIHNRHHCHRFRTAHAPPAATPPRGPLHQPPLRQVGLLLCSIPLDKLTLELRCVLSVGHKLQVLENYVSMCLSKACCTGIAGPCSVRGNHDQASKVGDQRGHSRRTEEVLDSP